MARYIDVEPLINWLESEINYFGEPNISIRPVAFGTKNALQSALSVVNGQPIADVVEVKHGEWIDDGDCFYCSVCNKPYQFGSLQTIDDVRRCWKCCANCGAIMNVNDTNVGSK